MTKRIVRPVGDTFDGALGDGSDETYVEGVHWRPDRDGGTITLDVLPAVLVWSVRMSTPGET